MRRINHCRFTRHLGHECAFHVCAGVKVKEKLALGQLQNDSHSSEIEVILINKENLNFISNNMPIIVMPLEIRLMNTEVNRYIFHWAGIPYRGTHVYILLNMS